MATVSEQQVIDIDGRRVPVLRVLRMTTTDETDRPIDVEVAVARADETTRGIGVYEWSCSPSFERVGGLQLLVRELGGTWTQCCLDNIKVGLTDDGTLLAVSLWQSDGRGWAGCDKDEKTLLTKTDICVCGVTTPHFFICADYDY
jgi:hypothetical protein